VNGSATAPAEGAPRDGLRWPEYSGVLLWAAGAAVVAGSLLIQTLATVRAFWGRRPITEAWVLDLLEDCKEELRVHAYLAVIETPHVRVPALFGWVRPRLLLPAGLLGALSPAQLRHVFLHELSHLKRHDVTSNWIMAVVQTVHWFNPLVWLAFSQARVDMELACDEMALAHLPEDEPRDYGDTLLALLGRTAAAQRLPPFATLGEDASQLTARIRAIAVFDRARPLSRVPAFALTLLLGAVFMVDAAEVPIVERPEARRAAAGRVDTPAVAAEDARTEAVVPAG
jgi:beta-lactamase regulating signal transducer with metallopeptidase domain